MSPSPSRPPPPCAVGGDGALVADDRVQGASRTASRRARGDGDAFWGDGYPMLTELLVIAQQLGCLTGWDIDPLLSVASARLDPDADMDLTTEPADERAATHERIARLARDGRLRERYEGFLRTVWAEGEPVLRELGRPTVERATACSAHACARRCRAHATRPCPSGSSIGGPCARPASTPSTGAASTTPRASGGRPRGRSTGTSRRQRALDRDARPLARWFPGGELNTCHNALDRHVDGGRGEQPALIYDSPVTGHAAHLQLPRAARRGRPAGRRAARARRRARRPRHPLPADGARGRDGHARVRTPRSDPLRRLRRLRGARARRAHRRRAPARRALGLLRHRGRAHDRLQAAARRCARARPRTRRSTA